MSVDRPIVQLQEVTRRNMKCEIYILKQPILAVGTRFLLKNKKIFKSVKICIYQYVNNS